MTRLIQLADGAGARRVALVDEPRVCLIDGFASVYALANAAIATGTPLSDVARKAATGDLLDYDAIYTGSSEWLLLPPVDHPDEPARCLISGAGLTHLGDDQPPSDNGADSADVEPMDDTMRMFQLGIEGGRPGDGKIGVAPEWFYKGTGQNLRGHNQSLTVPSYAEDGSEEAELAGVYVIDPEGRPRRIGMTAGNEFCDHRFERRNSLYVASSRLRECAIGPELVLDPSFDSVPGEAWIERGDDVIWRKAIASGEAEMSHSLQNLEHHHFKYALHRRPGDVHVHFFGAHSLSESEGVTLQQGDVMAIRFDGFGRTLRNVLQIEARAERLVSVTPLG